MEDQSSGQAFSKARRHGEVELGRSQITEVVQTQRRVMGDGGLGLTVLVAAPEAQLHEILVGRDRIPAQTVDSPRGMQPLTGLTVVMLEGAGIPELGGLLLREISCLLVGQLEESVGSG